MKASIAALFAAAFVFLLFSGWLTGLIMGNSAIDIQLHDTMFVIAHPHIFIVFGLLFGIFAVIYFLFPKLFGRNMNKTLGRIHFYVTLVGIILIIIPMHFMTGLPRRYYTNTNFETFNNFNNLAATISIVAIIVLLAQLLFVFNFLYSIFRGEKLANAAI